MSGPLAEHTGWDGHVLADTMLKSSGRREEFKLKKEDHKRGSKGGVGERESVK